MMGDNYLVSFTSGGGGKTAYKLSYSLASVYSRRERGKHTCAAWRGEVMGVGHSRLQDAVVTHEQPRKTPTYLGFVISAAAPLRLLHPVYRRASAIRRVGLQNYCPQRSCTGRGRIRFLESDLHDCSLASSNSSPQLIYLFVSHAPRVITFDANFVRLIAVFIRSSLSRYRKSRTFPAIKLCLTYLIC
jgi:hypothetical protein